MCLCCSIAATLFVCAHTSFWSHDVMWCCHSVFHYVHSDADVHVRSNYCWYSISHTVRPCCRYSLFRIAASVCCRLFCFMSGALSCVVLLHVCRCTVCSEGMWLQVNVLKRSDMVQETTINPYPTAFPYGNGMVLHFYQQQESSTTKTVHKVINKGLKTYV